MMDYNEVEGTNHFNEVLGRLMDIDYNPKQDGGKKMENGTAIDELGLGADKPPIQAKRVVIEEYEIKTIETKNNKESKKLLLFVKHPDITDRRIEISGVKYQLGDKIKTSGLWVHVDEDGKLVKRSALGTALEKLGATTIKDLKGKEADTVEDEAGYLVIKAY